MKDTAFTPVAYDKHGPLFSEEAVNLHVAGSINANTYFYRRVKKMTQDLNNATALLEEAVETFDVALDKFLDKEKQFVDASKKASGRVRSSCTSMGDGLVRLEKAANLTTLERHCELLERMADSMERLSALEEAGKLDKIVEALK